MTQRSEMEVLVIQYWIHDPGPIRAALETVGIDAALTRVDIEPALHAALSHTRFAVAIYAAPPTLARSVAEDAVRASQPGLVLVAAEPIASLGERVLAALEALRN